MMKSTKTWQGDDAGSRSGALLRPPVARRFFRQAQMGPVLVIIAKVITHEAFQMVFVEYDHMIEQFAPTAADEPFRNAILPRASETGPFRLDTEALDGIDYVALEIRGPIKDQVIGSGIVGEGFTQLLRSPCASRLLGGIEVKDPAPVMGDDKETIEHTKSQRRHRELSPLFNPNRLTSGPEAFPVLS